MDEEEDNKNIQRQTTEEPLIIEEDSAHTTLTYRLESSPPFAVTLFTAFQHILVTLPGCLYTAALVSDVACAPQSHPIRSTLFSGTLFMSGLGTLMQTMFGIRSLMLASLFEILMGSLGLLGFLLRFIGPITVAITISLIGFSLIKVPLAYARPSFPITLGCMVLIVIFVLYCQNVTVPIPRCGKQAKKTKSSRSFPLFQLIPILIAVAIMWVVSFVLTACGVFTDDESSVKYMARTDAKAELVTQSPWFQLTYPGMFGQPKVNIALAIGFVISCISSLVESVGDYYAAYRACEVVIPPNHAISRGVLVEGIGSVISGAVGVGHATTSYSGNISVITLSKNASRQVMYAVAIVTMLLSMVGKVGATMTTIPNPILGGVALVIISTLVSIGLSNLKDVDMTSTRNLLVVGLPFSIGLAVPLCLEKYPELIDTGITQVNQVLLVVLDNPMFLGGILATILDNTVPGSYQSRGMIDPHQMTPFPKRNTTTRIYSWSIYPKIVSILPFLNYLPFLPPATQYDLNPQGDIVMEKMDVV